MRLCDVDVKILRAWGSFKHAPGSKEDMKNKIITGIVALAIFALISGASILALASPGTQDDPYITLSYLSGIFKPQVMADVSRIEQELTAKFNEQINALEAKIQTGQSGSQAAPGPADTFAVVTLSNGQTLICSAGAELMLRVGAANGVGSAPALVDSTGGETLASGSALTANHMYLITIEGNGVIAASDTVRLLVRGNYKIT